MYKAKIKVESEVEHIFVFPNEYLTVYLKQKNNKFVQIELSVSKNGKPRILASEKVQVEKFKGELL